MIKFQSLPDMDAVMGRKQAPYQMLSLHRRGSKRSRFLPLGPAPQKAGIEDSISRGRGCNDTADCRRAEHPCDAGPPSADRGPASTTGHL